VTHIFVLTNDALIPDYEARLREQPEDASLYYKLAACYCNREKYAECCELLAPLVPEAEHAARYHDLYAYALMHTDAKDAALKHFQLWEKLEPDKIRLARELPAALLRLDRPEEALEKALLYQADFPQEAVLYDIRAQVLLQRGVNPDEVLPIIAAGLAANPEYLDLYRRQAEIYYERGLHAEALDSINEALDICPWHGEALLLKIRLYYQARDYATVRSIIAQARENYQLDHARLNVYYAAATLALPAPEAEENATAVTVLRHRLREQPADRVALRALTDYYEENDYLNPAIIILNDAIAAEPEYLPWRLWRIRLWRAAGETLTILEEINRLEKQVESADLMVEKGLAWQSRQEYDRARECFEQAIAYDEYHSRAYADLAELCQETKRFGEAADYYTRQLQVMPSAYYYLCRGYVYSRMGDPEKEEADYRSALRLEPDYDRAHNNMGVLLYEKEQWAEACEHLARACELNPRLFSARQFLAKTLYKMGAVEEALQILREAAVDFAEPPERPERRRSTARKILNALFAVALLVLVVAFNRSDRVGALPSALVNLAVLTVAVFITLRRVREHHPRRREKPETEAHVGWILTECYREIAGIYRKEGRYQEALDLIPYLQHAPVKRDAATLCHIAYCAAAQGQKRRSRHYYRQALRQDPHCEEARRALKPEATST
jgi:tetratricopeptide (TPR) repeat protein